MSSSRSLFCCLLLMIGVPGATDAAGLDFMKNAPIYFFTSEDRALMRSATLEVLNDEDGHTVREWKNPRNGYSGKVQGMGVFRSDDGLVCRKVKIWTQAKGIENEATYPACRRSDGTWSIASGKHLTRIESAVPNE